MEILGISALDGPSAACLLRDDRLVAAAREDRFSRRTGDRSFPLDAIAYCLRTARIGPADLAAVVLAGSTGEWSEHGEYRRSPAPDSSFRKLWRGIRGHKDDARSLIARELDPSVPTVFLDTTAAEAGTFLASPFDSAAILLLGPVGPDGAARGGGTSVDPLDLSLAGDPFEAARVVLAETKQTNLVLAGPGATGSVAGEMRGGGVADAVWAHPAAGCGASALGAALHHLCVESGRERPDGTGARLRRAAGPEYNSHQIRTYLRSREIVPEELPRSTIAARTAELLAEGRTVAWFQGRLDLPDEAIASRAILASPKNAIPPADRAPIVAVTRESAGAVLGEPDPAGTAIVAPSWRDTLGTDRVSVFVADRKDHRAFHDLLTAFSEIADVPFLLAHPLRAEGEPVACTPGDAHDAFLAVAADVLVIGPYALRRDESNGRAGPHLTERVDSGEIG